MLRTVQVGDSVIINGGSHKGKTAVVTVVTAKMCYVKIYSDGLETRVMLYNVAPINSSSTNDRSADEQYSDDLLDEMRKMRHSIDALVKILSSFRL
jgi:ribosomal protein L24